MSAQRPRSLEELIQAMKILSNNPEMYAKNPAMFAEIMGRIIPETEISFVSFKPSRREKHDLGMQMKVQIDDICRKIKAEVLEQIRSEISKLFDATKRQTSARSMVQAMSESIRIISEIQEVKEIYAFAEPENLRLVIVHDATDRIELLRKVVEIENSFDIRFEDTYFEFKVMHYSEIYENLMPEGLLIFKRT